MIESVLLELENWCRLLPAEGLEVDNILSGSSYYRKTNFQTPLADLSYYLCILGSGASGFAYFNGKPAPHNQLISVVDKPAIDLMRRDLDWPLRVALIDAVCEEYNKYHKIEPSDKSGKRGTYQEKANYRSKITTDHVRTGKKVVVVGLVTEFVRELLEKKCEVSISDLSPELRGKKIHGLSVNTQGNKRTLELIADADYAIVSGATLSSNTVDSILETAKKYNTHLCFYLETGGNLAPFLLKAGAKLVIAEKFPFYDLPGETIYEVHRA
ncbi:MAG: DUF364 domain-containing protein [Candidatus Saccharimonadales bacterium]